MASLKHPIAGGCLCGKVRYTIDFPVNRPWPPDAHTCQCTQCRKHSGSLLVHFLTVHPSQLTWSSPSPSTSSSSNNTPSAPFKEFASSAKGRRGFCSECGTALSWREESRLDEVEILTGTVDEKFLIGDRTTRVESGSLAERGRWEQVLREEEGEGKVGLGRDLCVPKGGNFFFKNAVRGVTDGGLGGKRFVEDTAAGFVIPE